MNICGTTAGCQMGLIEYACYSEQADKGLMRQADEHPATKKRFRLQGG